MRRTCLAVVWATCGMLLPIIAMAGEVFTGNIFVCRRPMLAGRRTSSSASAIRY